MDNDEQKELEKQLPVWAVKLEKMIEESKSKTKTKI